MWYSSVDCIPIKKNSQKTCFSHFFEIRNGSLFLFEQCLIRHCYCCLVHQIKVNILTKKQNCKKKKVRKEWVSIFSCQLILIVLNLPICYDKQTLFLLFCYLEKLTIALAFNIISIQHSSLLRKIIMFSQIKM